jgi:hypothetical protein
MTTLTQRNYTRRPFLNRHAPSLSGDNFLKLISKLDQLQFSSEDQQHTCVFRILNI